MKRRKNVSTPPAPATHPRRRPWLLPASIAVLIALGLWAVMAWRPSALLERVQAGLPVPPDLAGRPPVLGELLAAAEARARGRDATLEGLGDLGRLYHANGFAVEAAACWQLLRREQPDEARWKYYLADLRLAASDYPGMAALLQETLQLAPAYAPARLKLANLQFKTGAPAEAANNYQLRLKALPRDAHARLGLVRLALQDEQRDEARALLEQLLQDNPNFATAHNLYAEILAAAGDSAGARRHRWLGAETLRYREPEDPWLDELQAWCHDYGRLCMFGTIEMQGEQHDRARAFFERAIQLEPDDSPAYELLASLHLKRHDAAKARDLLAGALPRLGRNASPVIFILLSQALRVLEQPDEAIRVVRVGLAQAGDQPELLDALGVALAGAGRHEEALESWQAAIGRNPGDASANHNLAKSLLALHRLDDALAALDRSLTLRPTFLPTLLLRGEIELEAGHLEAAEKYLRPAFESHPHEPEARRLLAGWYQRMGAAAESRGDPSAAESHYQDGLGVDENHAELAVSLGVFYLVQQRFADAIPPLVTYRRLQPENPQACLFLGQAYASAGERGQARQVLTQGLALAERTGRSSLANRFRRLLRELGS